jgi:dienelactone hydrolase
VPGLWVPALLYEPDKLTGKVPVILNVNGHERTGTATPYIQERCINLAKRGMLALNLEWVGKGQLDTPGFQHYKINQLDLCGTSGVALHYLAMKRAIDLLLKLEHADAERLAVTGLPGGGWQTIVISSLDTRVKLANPVAGYSSFLTRAQFDQDLGDSEQSMSDLGFVADYSHLTALMAPRPTLLTYNAKDDCCFRADHAVAPLLNAARPVFALYDATDRLRYHLNHDSGHNYGRDNREAFYRLLRDFFYAGSLNAADIPSEAEVKTAAQLRVELPADNADFHRIAVALSKPLPRSAHVPQAESRDKLARLVRFQQFKVEAQEAAAKGRLGTGVWS